MPSPVKRLLPGFQPDLYKLSIHPNRDTKRFSGHVLIDGRKLGRPSQRIVLHQRDLRITAAKLWRINKGDAIPVTIDRINTHGKFEELRIHTRANLQSGNYRIELSFNGRITPPLSGIYLSTFKEADKEKVIVATQFESHYAREAFPCIDEPAAKAVFELSLISPSGETVLSNTPIANQTTKDRLITTQFEPTPKMSPYLLAFAFGDLTYLQSKTRNGIQVRAYATKQNVEFTNWALEVAVKVLEFYNQYFGIKYPLAKCDLLALPDFAAGAMENWGLITFREQALLVDPKNSSLMAKQHVALVIAHELAHQWFGNLVTMKWWTDLWLNEGFASWMEFNAVDHIFPEWQLWTQFAVDDQQRALNLDALIHTHPVEVPVGHPDEIKSIFDAISYSKGASMIHMLHKYIGPEAFKDGLSAYLKLHSYSNTETSDLWKAMSEVTELPVQDFMHEWITKPGYPILQVNCEHNQIAISQSRFLINQRSKVNGAPTWPVPLLANSDELPASITERHHVFKVNPQPNFMLNTGHSGFYRITYNPTHLEGLGHLIQRGKLNPLDRLGFLNDQFEAAKAGQVDTVQALHLFKYFTEEDNYAVWDVIAGSLASVRTVMDDDNIRDLMKPYVRQLVNKQLKRLGTTNHPSDSHFDKLLRPTIFAMASAAEEPSVVEYCIEKFKLAKPNQTKPPFNPDLRGAVYTTVARLGGPAEFEKLHKLHKASNFAEDRTLLAAALTAFKQPSLIKKALDLIRSDEVRLQDVAFWLVYSFSNRFSKQQSWDWVKSNWKWLYENLNDDIAFQRLPLYAVRPFHDEEFLADFKAFFMPRLSPLIERTYRQGLEILELQIDWHNRSVDEVKLFFEQTKA